MIFAGYSEAQGYVPGVLRQPIMVVFDMITESILTEKVVSSSIYDV